MEIFSVNIPVSEYDRLRRIEIYQKKSFQNDLVKSAKEFVELVPHDIYNHPLVGKDLEIVRNKLLSLLESECFEFHEY